MPFIKRDSPFNQERYVLLDVTRAFARRWSGANPTGIDRVCDAYVQRYRGDALAVLQHRGIIRVLGKRQSDQLFDLLHPDRHYSRCSMLRVLALALFKPAATAEYAGKIYVNPGHTDFDLGRHWAWVQSRGLRTLYLIHDLVLRIVFKAIPAAGVFFTDSVVAFALNDVYFRLFWFVVLLIFNSRNYIFMLGI